MLLLLPLCFLLLDNCQKQRYWNIVKKLVFTRFLIEGCSSDTMESPYVHSQPGHVQQNELLKLWQFIHQNSELFSPLEMFFVSYFLLFFMANILPPFVRQFSIPVSSPLLQLFTFAINLQQANLSNVTNTQNVITAGLNFPSIFESNTWLWLSAWLKITLF